MINATIICDGLSPRGHRLTTIECTFHRFILPEVNTYRKFSRSASSSRAIPLQRRIDEVRENPAIPVEWPKTAKGMVAKELIVGEAALDLHHTWLEAAFAAADYAELMGQLKLHKQTAARVLEPYLWQTNVISSTDFTHMFNQRIHKDAQPEFRELAIKMKEAYDASTPIQYEYGEWQLPYITDDDRAAFSEDDLKKISSARVAKTSYGNQGQVNIERDLALFNDVLMNNEQPHWAPLEMIATPSYPEEIPLGNFAGWHQFRHQV